MNVGKAERPKNNIKSGLDYFLQKSDIQNENTDKEDGFDNNENASQKFGTSSGGDSQAVGALPSKVLRKQFKKSRMRSPKETIFRRKMTKTKVNTQILKDFAFNKLPKDWKLREILLCERNELDASELWLKLTRGEYS